MTIDDLFRSKKITTKTRGKAIARHLGLADKFSEAEAKTLTEIDTLMSAKKISSVEEAINRYQQGDRAGGKSKTVDDYTAQNIDGELVKTEEDRRQDKMRQVDKTAEKSAGIIAVSRNIREAQYLVTGQYKTPEIKAAVEKSDLLVLDAIAGNIGFESELGNFLSGFESDSALPEATANHKGF